MALYFFSSTQSAHCLLWLSLALLGCHREQRETAEKSDSNAASTVGGDGSRAAAVERADRMAHEAARGAGASSADLLERAALIRQRLYRVGHRPVDALEAIENFRARERTPAGACRFALSRLLLEAELKRDPAKAFREVYALRAKQTDPTCRGSADRALRVLAAYQPLPSVLSALDDQPPAAPDAGSALPVAAPSANDSRIVVPEMRGAGNEPARLVRIERYGAKDAARVVVSVTRPTRFQVGEVGSDSGRPRLFVDIEQASSSIPSSYEVGGLLERVRVGAQPRGVRVVLDLTDRATHRVFYLPEPFRLVIDVMHADKSVPAAGGKRSVRRVVLDPGHGGHDPGAVGPSGLREKDVVLDIAHRAAPVLARELGISTLLTRDGDQFVPLDERTARANAFHADLFVSIHCNASEDAKARGVMSFVLDVGREELATRIAARENAASSEAAVELANALSRVTDKSSRDASTTLAELLQRATSASLAERFPDVPDGGVKQAGFYVLAGARMPAVLYEASFISNESGEARLNNQDFRQKLADAIVNAVRAYREGL